MKDAFRKQTTVRGGILAGLLLCIGALTAYGAPEEKAVTEHTTPIDIVLVLDNSGSMKKNDPDFLTRDVVALFTDGVGERFRVGMVAFDEAATLVEPLSDLSELPRRARFLKRLEAVDYSGRFSNSPAGVERAIYELRTNGLEDAAKVIVLLTDGIVDTGDRASDIQKSGWLKEDLTREAAYAGIKVFGIAFTDQADFSLIQTLAIKTGGDYFRAFRVDDIHDVFNRIVDRINALAAPPAAVLPPAEVSPPAAMPTEPTATPPKPPPAPAETGPGASPTAPPVPPSTREGDAVVPSDAGGQRDLPWKVGSALLVLLGCAGLLLVLKRRVGGAPSDAPETGPGEAPRPSSPTGGGELVDIVDSHIICPLIS